MPLHFVTVEFQFHGKAQGGRNLETGGRHRFLYGVETWIDGVDQRLEGAAEGEKLTLFLEPEDLEGTMSGLFGEEEVSEFEDRLALELTVTKVVKAEEREVVKALAASVTCCSHCGGH
jgi:FKBP-type peptidyl-prolyl cis-trans isomerase 2